MRGDQLRLGSLLQRGDNSIVRSHVCAENRCQFNRRDHTVNRSSGRTVAGGEDNAVQLRPVDSPLAELAGEHHLARVDRENATEQFIAGRQPEQVVGLRIGWRRERVGALKDVKIIDPSLGHLSTFTSRCDGIVRCSFGGLGCDIENSNLRRRPRARSGGDDRIVNQSDDALRIEKEREPMPPASPGHRLYGQSAIVRCHAPVRRRAPSRTKSKRRPFGPASPNRSRQTIPEIVRRPPCRRS